MHSTTRTRTLAVLRAGLAATWGRGAWPVGPLVMHGSLAALLCALVRDALPPYAYAIFALAIAGATLALPLLGEFGALLRADPSAEWIEAQPVKRAELRVARIGVVMTLVAALSFATLLPAALFAPAAMDAGARCALFAAGFAQAVVVVAALLLVQSVLGERVEALLVLLQTVLVVLVVTGLVLAPRFVFVARGWSGPEALPELVRWSPPAWYALVALPAGVGASVALHLGAWGGLAVALAALVAAPLPPATIARSSRSWMAFLLAPVRALATRAWVRARERGSFDLVWDALPLEREFVLRTYPMFGIPLAFLLVGAGDEHGPEREALLSLLLFSPPIYLPILLAHLPATQSPDARWILETAPVSPADVAGGTLKAVALRFLLPLYALLFALACVYAGPVYALSIAPPGALVCLIVLRQVFPMFAKDPPLSLHAHEVQMPMDWTGPFLAVAMALVVASIAAWRFIDTPWIGLAVTVALLVADRVIERRNRALLENVA